MPNRREFLRTATAAGGVLLTGGLPALAHAALQIERTRAPAPLKILVLGGTGFIGPHLVRYAAARGHKITIFTRGRHDAELPGDIERLQGDRSTNQLSALEGKTWDAVVDDSANTLEWVKQSTALLKKSVGAYMFTSSTGVYYPYLKRGVDESTPVHYEMADPKDLSESFGVIKANCEKTVLDAFGDHGIVVRPTYIVGPGDTSDRFPYWPQRLEKGGEVLAPGKLDDPMQIIDVRDLAEFMIRALENKQHGIFNVAGPKSPLVAKEFYPAAAEALNAKVKFTYVDDYDFLGAHGIDESIPWAMLKGNDYGMMSVKNDRAIAAGLTFRPLATTVRDTLAWWPTVPDARRAKPRFSITPDKEKTALADWHARGK